MRARARRAAALLVAAAGPRAGGRDRHAYHGIAVDPPEAAPPLRLARADGPAFDLAQERGKVVLLFFGYTHCPDVCPTTLADWKRVKQGLGADTARVRFVFVSVDPERDTPQAAAEYARQYDAGFVGLSGTPAEIDAVKRAFRVQAAREETGSAAGYSVGHTTLTYVVDPEGRLRLMYSFGPTPADVTADVQHLLD
jgi:protein SCO1/2